MKKVLLYITLALVMAVPCVAQETLSKEITIETEYVPVEQKVSKLNVLPAVQKTSVPEKNLKYSEWNGNVDFLRSIEKLEAYGYNTEYLFSDSRGYLDLGAGMQLNVVGSAGYRFIDTDSDLLGAWLQHTSTWLGKNTSPDVVYDAQKQKVNDNVVGVYYSHVFPVGVLSADAFYHLDNFNYFGAGGNAFDEELKNQLVNEAGVSAKWSNQVAKQKKFTYDAMLNYNYFGYSKNVDINRKGLNENYLNAQARGEGVFGKFTLGIGLAGDYLDYVNLSYDKHSWIGMFSALPYIRYNATRLNVDAGVVMNFSTHDGAVARFAPKVKVDYAFNKNISVYADVNGGKELHTLGAMHSQCRYLIPSTALGSTYSPVDAEVGVKLGKYRGLYAKPYFAYGVFCDEILPVQYYENNIAVASPYVSVQKYNINGLKTGIELGYNYNNIIDVNADFQYSPQENQKGYRTGLDRAEFVANAQVKITPIKPLAVTVGYEWRGNRCYYSNSGKEWTTTTLGDVNNLSLDASYQLNKTIGFFVNASNLLNQQWDEFVGIGAQKISVLGGVSLLF